MRIGVNALYLIPGGVGGTEIYLRNLLDAIARVDDANEWFVFANRETTTPLAAGMEHIATGVRATNRPARLIWEQTRLPFEARRLRLDCLFNPGFTAPAFAPCPNVTVFHDLQHKRHPEHFRRLDLVAWRFFLWLAVQRSAKLIVVSEETARDLRRFYGVGSVVIPHGVEPAFFELERAPEPFLLCVSTLHPHKNLGRLIRAFARFRESHAGYRLVLAGMRGFHTEAVERAAAPLGEAVRITGWLPRTELLDLYRRAAAFIYPSTFEGFGMPVLEALAAGLPVACSDIEPLRTIADGHALLFPPEDEDAMLESLGALVRGDAPRDGRAYAGRFSWEEAARLTIAAIRDACAEPAVPQPSQP